MSKSTIWVTGGLTSIGLTVFLPSFALASDQGEPKNELSQQSEVTRSPTDSPDRELPGREFDGPGDDVALPDRPAVTAQDAAQVTSGSLPTLEISTYIQTNLGLNFDMSGGIQGTTLSLPNLPLSARDFRVGAGLALQIGLNDGSVGVGVGVGVPLIVNAEAVVMVSPLSRTGNIQLSGGLLGIGGSLEVQTGIGQNLVDMERRIASPEFAEDLGNALSRGSLSVWEFFP